jgi:hypothetical protein
MTLEILNFHGFSSAELQRIVESEHHFPDVRKMVPRWRFADHFVGVNKMVLGGLREMKTEARELEAKTAENVVEILES